MLFDEGSRSVVGERLAIMSSDAWRCKLLFTEGLLIWQMMNKLHRYNDSRVER